MHACLPSYEVITYNCTDIATDHELLEHMYPSSQQFTLQASLVNSVCAAIQCHMYQYFYSPQMLFKRVEAIP